MERVLIACAMIEDEVGLVLRELPEPPPVVWLARGLHESPDRLRRALQEAIDRSGAEEVLLSFGLCGNALNGVGSRRSTVVAPRFHDCIHMLLSPAPGAEAAVETGTLYFTDGWLRSERFIANEYAQCLRQYGLERTEELYGQILSGYGRLCLLDTGAYPLCTACRRGVEAARRLRLTFAVEKGTLRVLRKLVTGQWDREFLVIPPGGHFSYNQFLFPAADLGSSQDGGLDREGRRPL